MASHHKEKPKRLGRGLQSLLGPIIFSASEEQLQEAAGGLPPNLPPDKKLRESFQQLDIDSIRPNPYQPRTSWNEEELAELADSIKANGIIQPVIARRSDSGYELIAGERRFRAARLAGLNTIPAIVRQATDEEMLELALVENIHRRDLNPIERAKAYLNYINSFSITQTEAAQRLGEDRSVVTNYLRLLDLPEAVQRMLLDGSLSMGHARAILGVPGDELRSKLANKAMAGRLSVREVERLVRKHLMRDSSVDKIREKPPHIVDLENKLRSELGTKVSIEPRKNGRQGRIIIEFYSLDEFDRIAEKMGLSLTAQA